MAFDTEDLRKGRENDWFRQNEEKLIEAARKRREEAERAQKTAEAESRRTAHWRKCPKCGSDMAVEKIADIEIEKCSSCEGIFFDRGELEQLLMKQEGQRRGFFRKLLGFSPE
ncbi:MAG TPA: zf-TFIIB domain-containing protein [Thermoanaerobaculia bacterium]|nr:zf-TFIIB domain-containing protein [Thermoanaerobaculia bacterium]